MNKFFMVLLSSILIIMTIQGCKGKKNPDMVDMDSFKTDGSHDNKYIFRKEIEKEEERGKKYKKNKF